MVDRSIVIRNKNSLSRPSSQPTSGNDVNAGVGLNTSTLEFEGEALMWDTDMPARFRVKENKPVGQALTLAPKNKTSKNAGTVALYDPKAPAPQKISEQVAKQSIASGVKQLDKPRKVGNRIVQRRIGWQATPTKIVVTVAERELQRRPDNKLAPSGEWLIEKRETYPAKGGAAQKRVGKVMDDSAQASMPNAQSSPDPNAGTTISDTISSDSVFPEGEMALACFPASVRASILGRTPNPTIFDGTILQWAEGGKPSSIEVDLIRGDDKHILVVKGEKPITGTEWKITQAFYTIDEPQIES